MLKMKQKILFSLVFLFFILESNAQCAMCRAVLESQGNQEVAKGINNGIVYLMSIPYILVGGLGFFIYWHYFRVKKS